MSKASRCAAVARRAGVHVANRLPAPTTTVVKGTGGNSGRVGDRAFGRPRPFVGTGDGATVTGSVAEGWEDLRRAFEHNFEQNMEVGAQLAVFKDGVLVVDLHGHAAAADSAPWRYSYDGNTLQNVFSSGKNLEAISIMMLVDRGQLRYADKISDHWPAFGQHGKGEITVEDVLRHESGLQFFADPDDPDDFSKVRVPTVAEVEATAEGAVERLIEVPIHNFRRHHPPPPPPPPPSSPLHHHHQGSAAWGHGQRMYHASTRGFVLGGLVRHITGKTLGRFIADEIATTLGVDVHCGATLAEQTVHEYAPMHKCTAAYTMLREVLPAMAPWLVPWRSANPETWAMFKVIGGQVLKKMRGEVAPLAGYAKAMPKEWEEGGGDHVHVSTPEGRTLEVSSGGVQANARSLAKIAGLIANGGALPAAGLATAEGGSAAGGGAGHNAQELRLVSTKTVHEAMGNTKRLRDHLWCMDISNTTGGFFDFGTMVEMAGLPCEDAAAKQNGFVGWAGKGGSLWLWNMEKNIGFAYVMNGMMNGGNGGPRTEAFFDVLRMK